MSKATEKIKSHVLGQLKFSDRVFPHTVARDLIFQTPDLNQAEIQKGYQEMLENNEIDLCPNNENNVILTEKFNSGE